MRRPASGPPRRLPLDITVDGQALQVGAAEPADLWQWCAEDNWRALVPGLLPAPQRRWLWARLADPDDRLDLPDLARIGRGVVAALTGTTWWAALRVAAAVEHERLMFTAWCAQRAMDPQAMPLHLLVGAGVAWMYEGVDDVDRLERALWTPPARVAGPRWTPQQEAASFRDAMASLAGRPGA